MEISNYINKPFKHLGLHLDTGIDCFNLIKLFYKNELNIDIPYNTRDWCNIVDTNWYDKTHERLIDNVCLPIHGWTKIQIPKKYSMITMSLSSTVTNHCALYLGQSKILHTYENHNSHISPYGNYFKQYTKGIFVWTGINE